MQMMALQMSEKGRVAVASPAAPELTALPIKSMEAQSVTSPSFPLTSVKSAQSSL